MPDPIKSFKSSVLNFNRQYKSTDFFGILESNQYSVLIHPIQDFLSLSKKFVILFDESRPDSDELLFFQEWIVKMKGVCSAIIARVNLIDPHLNPEALSNKLDTYKEMCRAKSKDVIEIAELANSYYRGSFTAFEYKLGEFKKLTAERDKLYAEIMKKLGL